jgi:phospholipid transport system substrate-binding protein
LLDGFFRHNWRWLPYFIDNSWVICGYCTGTAVIQMINAWSKNVFSALLGIMMLVAASPPVPAAEQLAEPQVIIEDISNRLMDILENERERLQADPAYVHRLAKEVLLPHVDFAKVSSLVLGKSWRGATNAQKTEFSEQFQRLLVRTYSTAFHEFIGDWEIRYLPVRANKSGDKVLVRTQVLRSGGKPVEVVYRMHLKDGSWKAYDVQIEGFSLVTNYRGSFAKEIRQTGMDGLIKKITELNDRRVKKTALEQGIS